MAFWTEERTRTLQQIVTVLFRPKNASGPNKGLFPLAAITVQLWNMGAGGEANTWSNALNDLRRGPPWPTAQRRSPLLAAFTRLRETSTEADVALNQAGLLSAVEALVHDHQQAFPRESRPAAVASPAAGKTTGSLDIFDRTLGIADPRLHTWLFGPERTPTPVVFSTYRRSTMAEMVARSVTIFHPPRPGEAFIRFSNVLRVNARPDTPDPWRHAEGVVLSFGTHLSLLANVQGSAAKIISLDRPDNDQWHPYFTGLVHTYSKKQVLAARIFMIRRLAAPIGDDDFLQDFPGLVGWTEARKSFDQEIKDLERCDQLKKKVLFSERLDQYLDNDPGNIPVLMPLSDHLTAPSIARPDETGVAASAPGAAE